MSDSGWHSANGKVILFGEHAVVYGVKAIAGGVADAVTVRAQCSSGNSSVSIPAWDLAFSIDGTSEDLLQRSFAHLITALDLKGASFHLDVKATVPPASGLGASAALAVASTRALAACYNIDMNDGQINAVAFASEQIAHSTPSGIDNTLATYGGLLSYCRREREDARFSSLAHAPAIPLVVGFTGRKGYTAETVARVRAARALEPVKYAQLFAEIARIVDAAEEAIAVGDFARLAVLMDENQRALKEIGVSCDEIEQVVHLAKQAGAFGAKLTGSGDGGAVIIYAADRAEAVHERLNKHGFKTMDVLLGAA